MRRPVVIGDVCRPLHFDRHAADRINSDPDRRGGYGFVAMRVIVGHQNQALMPRSSEKRLVSSPAARAKSAVRPSFVSYPDRPDRGLGGEEWLGELNTRWV